MKILETLLLVKVIKQLVACQIIVISKKNYIIIAIDLSKQWALDAH